jgi:flavodoxin/ferredoxin
MAKCLIVYFSQTGTTAQVADSISAGLRAAGYEVDLFNMNGERPPDIGGYDLFGVGSPIYFYRAPFNVQEYLDRLPKLNGLPGFVFVMYGTNHFDGPNPIRQALARSGARDVGFFSAHGPDLFVGYLKEGYVFSDGHPTGGELAQAEAFGAEVAARVAGKEYVPPAKERSAPFIYRLERFLTGRWFARNVYSRLFRIDKGKCTACGACINLCPTGNLTEGKGRRPEWGRNCLLCLTCELRCPEEAVTSPASWRLFRPFMIYNTRQAARDPAVDHVRIDPNEWAKVGGSAPIAAKCDQEAGPMDMGEADMKIGAGRGV